MEFLENSMESRDMDTLSFFFPKYKRTDIGKKLVNIYQIQQCIIFVEL